MRQLRITNQITRRDEKSTNLYFQDISKYSLITPEEEAKLTFRIRNGDESALEKLVVANLRFVISVAKQYQNNGLSFPDLINQGNLGLVIAAKKFDETRGFKFISYAVWWIRQSIMQAISEQTRTVRLPLNRLTIINKIVKASPHIEQIFQRDPTDEEIADYLDIPYESVKTANTIKKRQVSFDKSLVNDRESDLSLYDIVKNDSFPAPDSGLLEESLKYKIQKALTKLSKREADILTMSFGLNNTAIYSLHRIALKFGTSTERIRQIRKLALLKMKKIETINGLYNEKD